MMDTQRLMIGGSLLTLIEIAQKDLPVNDDDFMFIGDLCSFEAYDSGVEHGKIKFARKLLDDLGIKWDHYEKHTSWDSRSKQ